MQFCSRWQDLPYLGHASLHDALFRLISGSIHGTVDGPGLFGTEQAAAIIGTWLLPLVALFILGVNVTDG